jgi:hypothetical protein
MGNYKSFGDTKFVPNLPKVSWGGSSGLWLENKEGTLVGVKGAERPLALSLGHWDCGVTWHPQVLQMDT